MHDRLALTANWLQDQNSSLSLSCKSLARPHRKVNPVNEIRNWLPDNQLSLKSLRVISSWLKAAVYLFPGQQFTTPSHKNITSAPALSAFIKQVNNRAAI